MVDLVYGLCDLRALIKIKNENVKWMNTVRLGRMARSLRDEGGFQTHRLTNQKGAKMAGFVRNIPLADRMDGH
jgi:hypothetical protein